MLPPALNLQLLTLDEPVEAHLKSEISFLTSSTAAVWSEKLRYPESPQGVALAPPKPQRAAPLTAAEVT